MDVANLRQGCTDLNRLVDAQNAPRRQSTEGQQQLNQRCFAGAIRANEPENFARLNLKGDLIHGPQSAATEKPLWIILDDVLENRKRHKRPLDAAHQL